jgi:hypothetical protein
MNKLGLPFVNTSRQTTFRTLVRVLLYGHVVYVSSCSLVVVSQHERIPSGTSTRKMQMQDLIDGLI